MEQRELGEPHIDHFQQVFLANFVLFNDFSESRDNVIFAVTENLGLFTPFRNLQCFEQAGDAFRSTFTELLVGFLTEHSNTIGSGLSDSAALMASKAEKGF